MKCIHELLKRLWLFKKLANTSPMPMFAISRIYRKGMFVVCCVHDNNVAGFNNDVALNLDLRTLDVGGYYVPATGK